MAVRQPENPPIGATAGDWFKDKNGQIWIFQDYGAWTTNRRKGVGKDLTSVYNEQIKQAIIRKKEEERIAKENGETDETTDDKIKEKEDEVKTSPEKVENMNEAELEKERMIIAGDANNDGKPDPPTEQRMAAYKQLIEDGPQGAEWDLYIKALKRLYPELENYYRKAKNETNVR